MLFCSTECERKESAEKFPKNFALIRLAEKARQTPSKAAAAREPVRTVKVVLDEPSTQGSAAEMMCPLHQRKLEIICI